MHSVTRASATEAAVTQRSLMPREHGAYGQLAMPLLAALASAKPTPAALLFAAAAVSAFLAHEPLLVVLAQRSARVRREEGGRARVRLVVLAMSALVLSGLALALAAPAARLAFAKPLVGAILLALLIWRKHERSAVGELLAACALSAAAIPVAVASGLSAAMADGAWGAFALGFGLLTFAVRRAIQFHKGSARGDSGAWAVAGLCLLSGCCLVQAPVSVAVAALPMGLLGCGVLLAPPHPRHLRRLGWMLMLASLATALLLAWAARSAAH